MPGTRPATIAALALVAAVAASCGSGSTSPGSPTPSPASDPCVAALATLDPPLVRTSMKARTGGLGHDDRDPREFLALHRIPHGGRVAARAAIASLARMGQIAVLADDGGVVIPPNRFDLGGRGLLFEPAAGGGYDVRGTAAGFRTDLGSRVPLGDDDSREEALAFPFDFYGTSWSSASVNSDGNLTFGRGDTSTDERSLRRVLSGAPRVAPFFADLDPSAGGGVFVSAAPDAFTVTWCAVPGFDSTDTVTAQASLLPGGAVEVRIAASTTLGDAVVALSPGATDDFTALDLSQADPAAGGGAAVGERFASVTGLDLVAASRRFYAAFPDAYDQILFWTDTHVTGSEAFAFETTVNNAIEGIGQGIVDLAAAYGSGGRLASLVVMDDVSKYPADPDARVVGVGENTTLSLLAHETGHRWGATLHFRDASGEPSDLLLGRQLAHWSFFCDSDASVLEGNDIEDLGEGSFQTVGAVTRYGPLDLYAMGVLEPGEVPRVVLVEDGRAPAFPAIDRESAPRTGVSLTGTRREVTIDDIVAAMGPRRPPAARAPRRHRQAWVFVVSAGRTADPAAVETLERFREAFEAYFEAASGGRMSIDTRLD